MFGDQNIFCRKSDFLRADGFDEALPIMEDLDLVMRLHMAGPSTQQGDTQRCMQFCLFLEKSLNVHTCSQDALPAAPPWHISCNSRGE